MEINYILSILWRRKWIIAITTIIALATAIIITSFITPLYTAVATIRIATAASPLERPDLLYAERVMDTYIVIAESRPILERVAEEVDSDLDVGDLRDSITIRAVPGTEISTIAIEHPDPDIAAQVVNKVAEILITEIARQESPTGDQISTSEIIFEQIDEITSELVDLRDQAGRLPANSPEVIDLNRAIAVQEGIYEELVTQYDQTRLREELRSNAVTLVSDALPPENPSSPSRRLAAIVGGAAGLLGGVAISLAIDVLQRTIYSIQQVQSIIPMRALGSIPNIRRKFPNQTSQQREAYRRLRVKIMAILANQGTTESPIIALVSAKDKEGKSTLIANLAFSITQLNHKVLIIDGDFRTGKQHKLLGTDNQTGLTDVVNGDIELNKAIQKTVIDRLYLLSSGSMIDNASELLTSIKLKEILEAAQMQYDYILIDTPSLISVVDAMTMLPLTDLVFQVVRRGFSKEVDVLAAHTQVTDIHVEIESFIVNYSTEINYATT